MSNYNWNSRSENNHYNHDRIRNEYDEQHHGGLQLYDAVQDAIHGPHGRRALAIRDIRELIAAGADINTPGFYDHDTPLHYASKEGADEIVKLLIDAGARVDYENIQVAPAATKNILRNAPRLSKNAKKRFISSTISKRAKNQAIRNIVEQRAGIASEPGTGASNIIRRFAGVQTPKRAEGAFQSNSRWVRKGTRKGGRRTHRLKRRL